MARPDRNSDTKSVFGNLAPAWINNRVDRISLVVALIAISRIKFIPIHAFVLHIILRQMIHVGFVKHSTDNSLMQIRNRLERMPHNLDPCTAPFNHQNHAVHQVSSRPSVNYRHNRRKIDYNEIKAFPQPIDKPFG